MHCTGECTPVKLYMYTGQLPHNQTPTSLFVLLFVSLHNADNTTGHHCITHSNTDTHISCECRYVYHLINSAHNISMQPILQMPIPRLSPFLLAMVSTWDLCGTSDDCNGVMLPDLLTYICPLQSGTRQTTGSWSSTAYDTCIRSTIKDEGWGNRR